MNKSFNVALIQIAMDKDPLKNVEKAKEYILQASKLNAQVICLPELYKSRYFCQREDIDFFNLAETIPGPSTTEISKLAKDLKVAVVVPVFEKRALGVYHNSAAIIDADGSLLGIYRKMHIPDDPGFYEKFYFAPGDLGYKKFDTKYGSIGSLICWDQWYPEAARLTSLKGANILFYPTAIGWHPYEKEEHGKPQYESWVTIQRSHAIANGVYVAACNRVGLEVINEGTPGIEFWGQSFIADPQGVILAQASSDKEEIICAEVNLDRIEYIRRNWPFLRDRRIDSYSEIENRFSDTK